MMIFSGAQSTRLRFCFPPSIYDGLRQKKEKNDKRKPWKAENLGSSCYVISPKSGTNERGPREAALAGTDLSPLPLVAVSRWLAGQGLSSEDPTMKI